MLKVTVTFTFDRLTTKSVGIIYTPRRMSLPNLTNLGHSLSSYHPDKVRSTDRLTDPPTDICKALYPHFVEGGIIKVLSNMCLESFTSRKLGHHNLSKINKPYLSIMTNLCIKYSDAEA